MTSELHLPNKPKQDRSLKRFNNALLTANSILISQGIRAVTIQEVSKKSGERRSSLYKFFPSNLAILSALGELHAERIISIFKKNSSAPIYETGADYFYLLIDLLSIYLNQNKSASILIFKLRESALYDPSLQHSDNIITLNINSLIGNKLEVNEQENITVIYQIILSVLSGGFRNEGLISPRVIVKAKKAASSYMAVC